VLLSAEDTKANLQAIWERCVSDMLFRERKAASAKPVERATSNSQPTHVVENPTKHPSAKPPS
jgi:hypothetical protein